MRRVLKGGFGRSVALTLPKHVARMLEFEGGMEVEIELVDKNSLLIRKVTKEAG